ncbi:MAG: hypothetical protein KC619_32465 [Myxococcales bacterium]|nr:hypothetical protein [Myxococcales bacterium]
MAWTAEALRAQVWETLSGGPIQSVPHNGFPAFRVASEVPEILVIECAWRILRDGVVVVGTGFGDGDKIEALEALVTSTLREVEVRAPHLELVLVFDGGRLETIADAPECWWLLRGRERRFTVGLDGAHSGE